MTSRNSEVDNTVTGVHDRVEFVGVPAGHHVQQENFNLERFEYQVTQADTETAARMLLLLLAQLDNHFMVSGVHSFRRMRRVRPWKG